VRAVSTNVAPPRLLFGLPLDAGVDASKNPPFWTDATKIREEPIKLFTSSNEAQKSNTFERFMFTAPFDKSND